ncbi:MAG TPA: S-methyl-5-thioribose-1-phosphate isomerase, partial [Clostridiaceae bacterium]|nr:S-methyl-5-thioribose-1-phosphate isomerase [Clostridiaceae bacterium]
MSQLEAIWWQDGCLSLLDQNRLPGEVIYLGHSTVEEVFKSIRTMVVRGAPAIGVTAAYGMVLAAKSISVSQSADFISSLREKGDYLKQARPTAVNLAWAVDRMLEKAETTIMNNKQANIDTILSILEDEAICIHEEDIQINRQIGLNLLSLVSDGDTILTHCNAGALATAGYGTALSVFYVAQEQGISLKAYADETRPRLQGARLTAFELSESGVDVTLITDNMAALVMAQGKIDAVVVGCDRVAANGDVANKIGTLGVSLLANHFNIPVYIATPTPTIDMNCPTGIDIPIEERSGEEIRKVNDTAVAPPDVKVYNPAFDVTPA